MPEKYKLPICPNCKEKIYQIPNYRVRLVGTSLYLNIHTCPKCKWITGHADYSKWLWLNVEPEEYWQHQLSQTEQGDLYRLEEKAQKDGYQFINGVATKIEPPYWPTSMPTTYDTDFECGCGYLLNAHMNSNLTEGRGLILECPFCKTEIYLLCPLEGQHEYGLIQVAFGKTILTEPPQAN